MGMFKMAKGKSIVMSTLAGLLAVTGASANNFIEPVKGNNNNFSYNSKSNRRKASAKS